MAEFPSVVDAVNWAVEVQAEVAELSAEEPDEQRIEYRMGVNLGDVIADGDDIYGDGVNIAARLQEIAEPGGVCISEKVHAEVLGKLGVEFADGGAQAMKNIALPVQVWHWSLTAAPVVAAPADKALALPDKPSIAVLPFDNMSGDPEQEFFADGITEDIITELSRFRDLLVISRNSAFFYKGKAINVQEVAKDLDVQYVVEGSVRKAGNRVRISVQLIDAGVDRHVWAERYDRDLEDIFAVQDEVTSSIVSTLPGRIEAAARERVERKLPENMVAYESVLAGKLLHHKSNKEDNQKAQVLLDRAIGLDPKYAHAHAWKACTLGQAWGYGWCVDKDVTWDEVVSELQIALALDDNDSDVHRILAAVDVTRGDLDKAMYHQERALSLNPNDDLIVVQQGEVLTWLGQAEEGIKWIKNAMRLNPYHPERFWSHLGRAYFVAHRYDEAIEAFKRIATLDYTHHAFLAASFAQMDDVVVARNHAEVVIREES